MGRSDSVTHAVYYDQVNGLDARAANFVRSRHACIPHTPQAIICLTHISHGEPMHSQAYYLLLTFVCLLALPLEVQAQEKKAPPPDHQKWAKDIARFEKSDEAKPPPKHAILFAGSSSMVFWNTTKSFPNLVTINRGFGGSQLRDSVYYAPRIILKYEPRIIVVYAGDNDLAQGITPTQLANNFVELVKVVHDKLPETRIYFIAVKPSTKRWELFSKQQEANRQIEAICKKNERLAFIDIVTPMLGSNGKPKKELLREDGLHLSDQGYALWTAILKPMLEKQLP